MPARGADRLGADPAAAHQRSAAALHAAADRPGVLERSQATPMGATGVERVRCVRPAQVVTVTSDRGGWPDASTPNRVHTSTGVRGLPVSAGGDHSRGPLVPPLRLVLSRHRGAGRAGPSRSTTSRDRWFVDEIYVKVAGRWRYLYRAVDQYGQVIDVLPSEQRDTAAARRFFSRALSHGPAPVEVTTNKAGPYLRVLDELVPAAAHVTEQCANDRIEADHGQLKARLRPMPTQTSPVDRPDSRRTCLRPEPPHRPLRTGHRRLTAAPAGNGIQRARAGHATCPSVEPTLATSGRNRPRPSGGPVGALPGAGVAETLGA